ncbi:MAG: tetratricopeptide repeat protein [Actinomycetota bacterium]|nr:tetratricopeptide repeat protein [Actinomycetota bacterium]
MTRTRLAIAGMVAALAATILLFGGVLAGGSSADGSAPANASPLRLTNLLGRRPAAAGQTTRAVIAGLQQAARANPRDAETLTQLGLAYQQHARETGDPSAYPRSEGVLRRALELRPRDALAVSGLGSLALSRHRFREALALGQRAVAREPDEARHWGVVGDALVELGRYGEAFRAFDRMAALEPSASSYARVAYARELLGRPRDAVAPMRLAVEASGSGGEAHAWSRVQLGKLLWSLGRIDAAGRQYGLALAAFPGYVHALDALAQVEAAKGRLRRAIALERRAVDAVPLPQFVAALGDLYREIGRPALAREQYALIGAIQRLMAAGGVRSDLEIALFDVDHGIHLRDALRRARLAHRDRPSIDGDDVVAWALARNGLCRDALRYSRQALRLGTRDAVKLFHRGMIERCLGRHEVARRWFGRALALNPRFSLLWAPVATRYAS